MGKLKPLKTQRVRNDHQCNRRHEMLLGKQIQDRIGVLVIEGVVS